jgi:hypothetical protein
VIVTVNAPRSEAVRDLEKLTAILNDNAGNSIEIGLLRSGRMQLVTVAVPPSEAIRLTGRLHLATPAKQYRIGVSLAAADETLRSQLQLKDGEGVVVTEVIAATPAEKAGVKQHDVLIELDSNRLAKVEEITEQIQQIGSRRVLLKLLRSGKPEVVELTPEIVESYPTVAKTPIYYVNDSNELVFGSAEALASSLIVAAQLEPRGQIRALKDQLAQMQKLLDALEASLAPAQQQPKPVAGDEFPKP